MSGSLVGSHVAVGGGLIKVGLGEAAEIAAEVIQVFLGNPRAWAPVPVKGELDLAFREACEALAMPVFVHAPHLLNFGSPTALTLERSATVLTQLMRRASSIGATAVVMHGGSSVLESRREEALAGVHDLVAPIVDRAPGDVRLLIEPTAGGGAALASTIDSTLEYMAALDDIRVGVCVDTCHLHAAGEDVVDPAAFRRTLERLADGVGRDRLGLIHVNDSRDAAGSRRDRHESLGKGSIGLGGLAALFTTPVVRGVPLVVETPTHLDDVACLKRLRAEHGGEPSDAEILQATRHLDHTPQFDDDGARA